MRLPEDVAVLVAHKMQLGCRARTSKVYELALPVALHIVHLQLCMDTIEALRMVVGVRP